MRVIVGAESLRAALDRAVTNKGTIPILEHALLEAADDETAPSLSITTTDFMVLLSETVPAEVSVEGAVAAHALKLRSALHRLQGDVVLETHDNKLQLHAGKRRYTIPSLPATEFPEQHFPTGSPLPLNGSEIRQAIGRVSYAGGRKDVRYFLNAIVLDDAQVVAADGCRLAIHPLTAPTGVGALIPRLAIPSVLPLLSDECSLYADDTTDCLKIVSPSTAAHIACIARHPKEITGFWRRAIPMENLLRGKVTVDSGHLKDALTRIAPFSESGTETKFHRIALGAEGGQLYLKALTSTEAVDTLDCDIEGTPNEVIINPLYLKDLLTVSENQRITWQVYAPNITQIFTFADRHDIHLIAPMR